MKLPFIKRIASAALLAGLIVLALPKSALAMTIAEQFATLKVYFQERSILFAYFRAPIVPPTAYAEDRSDNEREAAAIERYMQDRSMPLAKYSALMVEKAHEHSIDWRLLPAIAIRESSGGKFACGNNPFGWASCKTNFNSIEEAINVVAWNLGGHNPNTAVYYQGETAEKLQSYNGAVIPRYPAEVMRIMERITAEL